MRGFLEGFFGPSWRTSSSGITSITFIILAVAIDQNPTLVAFLSDGAEKYVIGISKLVAAVSGILFVLFSKDNAVTGGKVPQTEEAKHRIEDQNKIV